MFVFVSRNKYVLYYIDLYNGTYSEFNRTDIKDALEVFYDNDPNDRLGYIYMEEDESCINYGQGWIASNDESLNRYIILFKNEPGIFEHFMKYCKSPDRVRTIIQRCKNIEILLNE